MEMNILTDKNLYYVGGVVRDEFLGTENADVDYCYEGDAIKFVNKHNIKKLQENPKFGTVRVTYQGVVMDIASTRIEEYPRKGHLPLVTKIGTTLKEDMKRRDFTINAIAKRTTDGEIIDFYGGRKDIENKVLRVLHNNSFIDDPTRIIRGLKFSIRFGFELDPETKKLQDEYLENINYDISYYRLRKEIVDAFSLNKKEVFDKFVNEKMYKLLGKNQEKPKVCSKDIENLLKEYPTKYSYLVYLSFFDLSKLPMHKIERKILLWEEKLKTQEATKYTPVESLLIRRLKDGL